MLITPVFALVRSSAEWHIYGTARYSNLRPPNNNVGISESLQGRRIDQTKTPYLFQSFFAWIIYCPELIEASCSENYENPAPQQ
jgi:hypothetical protein